MRPLEDIEAVLEHLYDGLYVTDTERNIRYWNKAAEEISGFCPAQVLGTSCADNILVHIDADGNELCENGCPLAATIRDGQPRKAEAYLHHRAGHRVPVSVRITPLRSEQGEIVGAIQLFTEMSDGESLKARIAELQQLALVDPLTQMPNRRHLESRFTRTLLG